MATPAKNRERATAEDVGNMPPDSNALTISSASIRWRYQLLLLYIYYQLVAVNTYQSFQTRIPHGNAVPNPCHRGCLWAGVGHQSEDGGNTRNPFGIDFKNVGFNWNQGLCELDSDGDGMTNGEELGDSLCQFDLTLNISASESQAIGHPGICEPIDSLACRERHLALQWDPCPDNTIRKCITTVAPPAVGQTPVTQPGGCIDTFNVVINTMSYNGLEVVGVETMPGCKAECLLNVSCLAFDYNTHDRECFLHLNSDYQLNLDVKESIDQYQRVPCQNNSTTLATPTPACVDQFERFPNTLSYEGMLFSDGNTLDLCRGACRANAVCYAFDFNFIRGECYIHDAGYLKRLGQKADGVDQYRRQPCYTATEKFQTTKMSDTCVDSFQILRNTHSFDGLLQRDPTNSDECGLACLANLDCQGFDFNNIVGLCYLHSEENLRTSVPMEDTDQYRRIPCTTDPTGCVDTFERFQNVLARDGLLHEVVTEINLCEKTCKDIEACEAFDFDYNTKACYTHYTGYMNRLKETDVIGVDQFRRLRCQTQTTPTGCVDRFLRFPNTQSIGGRYRNGVESTVACTQVCRDTPDCVAFDFNRDTRECYTHSPGYLENLLTEADNVDGVDQYRYSPCVDGTGATTFGPCVDSFDRYPNTLSLNGEPLPEAGNVEECKMLCREEPRCQAVDFDNSKQQCFAHLRPLTEFRTAADGVYDVDQYRRVPCESATGAATDTVCIDSFERHVDTLAYGGTRQNDAKTVEACQQMCLQQSTCFAFDFSRDDRICYTHPEDFLLLTFSRATGADVTGVDQFRRIPCNDQKNEGSPATCVDSFLLFMDTFAYGGIELSVNRLQDCQQRCLEIPTCLAFDFNKYYQCYIHEVGYEGRVYSQEDNVSGVNQYRRKSCTETGEVTESVDCPVEFVAHENTLSFGGSSMDGYNSVFDCSEACRNDEACQAFDFDIQLKLCYRHTNGYVDRALTGSGVTQYRKVSTCDQACQDTFTRVENTLSYGGKAVSRETVLACQEACVDYTDFKCVAFDFTDNNQCYLHPEGYGSRTFSRNDVDQYQRSTECDGVTHKDCTDTFDVVENTLAYGGEPHDSRRTREGCEEECLRQPACYAYDFNHVYFECYTHPEGFTARLNTDARDVTQYRRNFCDLHVVT